jgi:hypothetical protein
MENPFQREKVKPSNGIGAYRAMKIIGRIGLEFFHSMA